MRIDRRRKLPVTTLLMALDNDETEKLRAERAADGEPLDPEEAVGMSPEEILDYFYDTVDLHARRQGLEARRSMPSACAASS